MNKIFQFLQSSTGELSSKRLSFIITIIAYTLGSLYFVNKLINVGKAELAINLWNVFAIVVLFLGGYVTADLIERILNKKND